MRSPNTSSLNRGFTLIEIVIVIAILAVVMSVGLMLGIDAYRSSLSRSERDQVVALLANARSRAMANVNQSAWGVCTNGSDYVLFAGTCGSGGQTTPIGTGASVVGLASPGVTFAQLSGDTTATTITVTQQSKVSTIQINAAGTINW